MRVDLGTAITWDGARSGLRSFARWWRDELLGMVPKGWRSRIDTFFDRRTIAIEGSAWHIAVPGRSETLALDLSEPDTVLRGRIAEYDKGCFARRIDVQIPESDGLVRRIHLPAAAEYRLRSVVSLQLDRLSPLRGEDVRFDCRKAATEEGGTIDVEVAFVPNATLQAYEARLKGIGLVPGRFRFSNSPFTFAPVDESRTPQERAQLVLAGVAAFAWVAAIVATPVSRDGELADLSDQVAALRAQTATAAAARDEVFRMQRPLAAATARLAQPSALDALRKLSEVLPNNVRLSGVAMNGSAIRIAANGGDAKQIAALLDKSGYFHGARIVSSAGGASKFEIEMSAAGTAR